MPDQEAAFRRLLNRYSFNLPDSLIARNPCDPRDHARLMVLTESDTIHTRFDALTDFLKPGDLLVLNDTIVEHRRVWLVNVGGRKFESLFLCSSDSHMWLVTIRGSARLRTGDILYAGINPDWSFRVISRNPLMLGSDRPVDAAAFRAIGEIPIPPYLRRKAVEADNIHYQTVFARRGGSIAASTAALHFTKELMDRITDQGVETGFLTLNIGYGTFAPLRVQNMLDKSLHEESYRIPGDLRQKVKSAHRVIAVGTTVLRALESAERTDPGGVHELSGNTSLLVTLPDSVKSIDCLITNFHLPASSLIMLAAALCGRGRIIAAYQDAIAQEYRFYSYGDAMFIPNLRKRGLISPAGKPDRRLQSP